MRKSALFALTLSVLAAQTVGWVECCCVLICKHHNDPCKDECKEQPKQASAPDCCAKPASSPAPAHRHDRRCSHVEPSSDVVAQATELQQIDPPAVLIALPGTEIVPTAGVDRDLPVRAARGSPPLLHLLYGSLLI